MNPTTFCLSLLLLVTFAAPDAFAQSEAKPESTEPAPTVSLTIDYGDGMQKRFPAAAISADHEGDFTVADVLSFAAGHPRGIKIKSRGEGETAFLLAIDGLENEGAGKRNWMLVIDGELANASYAASTVEAGTNILWEFRAFK